MNLKDRVRETTTVLGTGQITPNGAATGFRTFLQAFGSGVTTDIPYCITQGTAFEIGRGTYDGTANTLSRDTVEVSSNGGALVTFGAGTKDVLCVASASVFDGFIQNERVSLYPEIPSAATIDIFGAAGATVGIDNSTPVTTTDFTDCTAAQVGSVKRVIPVEDWTVTASANLTVDGATSGDFVMPADALLEVTAVDTGTFKLVTIFARGSWTPSQGAGLTVVGAFSSTGEFTKRGNIVDYIGSVAGGTSVACSAAGILTAAPFTAAAGSIISQGQAMDANANAGHHTYISAGSTNLRPISAIAATARIYFSGRIVL